MNTETKTMRVSSNNWLELWSGFQPAFINVTTGETHLSVDSNGELSIDHSFHGLPDDWVIDRDSSGEPLALHTDIVAGYWRNSEFYDLRSLHRIPIDA